MDLNNNQVTGSFPDNVGDEKGLVFLDVSYNQLTGSFPSGLYELSVLRIIEAHNNMFSGTISQGISKLKVLSKMNLGSNLLTGPIPDFEGDERKQNIDMNALHTPDELSNSCYLDSELKVLLLI